MLAMKSSKKYKHESFIKITFVELNDKDRLFYCYF